MPKFIDHVLDGATMLVASAAVLVAGSVTWDRLTGRADVPLGAREDRLLDTWHELVAEGHWVGPRDASVVILEFGDYECPFCRRAEHNLRALRGHLPADVAVVYRHFPLSNHAYAYDAARWAECGAEQDAFVSVHKILYELVSLSLATAEDVARLAGVADTKRFTECADRTGDVPRIEADLAVARRLGLLGTPSIAVNGMLLGTPPDSAALFALADSILSRG